MKQLFFVYGTLKRGYGNNVLLNRAKFVGTATTVSGGFRMMDGGFPMVFTDGLFNIKGEVFEVSEEETVKNLDRLEGVPSLYTREKVVVHLTDNSGAEDDVEVNMYVTNPRYAGRGGAWITPDDNNNLEWN